MIEFTVPEVQRYAQAHRLEDWVHTFLMNDPGANPGLSNGLKLQHRWWAGPLELPLSDLARCTGPESTMEYVMSPERWERRVNAIQTELDDPLQVPPLIAVYQDGILSIRDGNHRYEAMRRQGWATCWALIWYNTRRDYMRHRLCDFRLQT